MKGLAAESSLNPILMATSPLSNRSLKIELLDQKSINVIFYDEFNWSIDETCQLTEQLIKVYWGY